MMLDLSPCVLVSWERKDSPALLLLPGFRDMHHSVVCMGTGGCLPRCHAKEDAVETGHLLL